MGIAEALIHSVSSTKPEGICCNDIICLNRILRMFLLYLFIYFLCAHKVGAYSVALVRPSVRLSVCSKSRERNSS
jgi:hypothetical protein